MANDVKVIFRGNKAPSGKNTNIEYMISSERKKQLDASKMFNIDVIDMPKAKPEKKSPKKEKKE